ncbi:MAG: alpha/beta hydrolase [Alphaproteobacteria bacterium]|nr:alpha/beta hydrolase [Alphaproteobacteria bacterium]MDP6591209.1 alpha/beta hydrolase [Alphaproteobacteria bacterium]MDP6818230.1 alpha/beta hydrolase [Alphaproteobacteria bacterium]
MTPLGGAVERQSEAPAAAAARALSQGVAQGVASADGFIEHSIASFDNTALYVREYGARESAAPPLLCLAGYTRNCRDFHDLALRHGKARRVLCPDMRGRGKSAHDADPRHYAVETAMADLLALLDALRLEKCVVLGTSFGGVLGMALAVLRPRALAGLILNDCGPEFDTDGLDAIVEYAAAPRPQPDWRAAARHGRELIGSGWDKDDAAWLKIARQGYSLASDGLLHVDYDPAIVKPLAAFAAAGKRGKEAYDMWAIFRALGDIPTLLLRGALSSVLKEETARAMIGAKPDLEHVTVPGVGHAPFLDEPQAIEAIDGYLARFG